MLFTVIVIMFILIILIAVFGDYKSKEIEKDKEKYKEITGKSYY